MGDTEILLIGDACGGECVQDGSQREGPGMSRTRGKGVRRGREGNAHIFILRLQLQEGPAPEGNLLAKTAPSAAGAVAREDCISPKEEPGV